METDQKAQQQEEDDAVLRMLREGDPRAAERLLAVFGDRVYGLSLRILNSEEDAKETVQETFLTIWRKWQTFKGKSKFSSWIYRIAANQALMRLRKRKKRRNEVSMEQMDEAGAPDPTMQLSGAVGKSRIFSSFAPDEELQNRELRGLIQQAVDSLSPMYRSAYMLKDIDGLSLKAIAEVMDISEPAAKSRVHRARLELRRKLAPYLDRKA